MKLKNMVAVMAALTAAFSLTSCSEDFKVAAPYKDITVVYGLLNVDDSVQYIRIQKTFMDENRSATDLAKISDSSYYPEQDIDVHLKGINGNGSIQFDEKLNRVDLANEGLPKNPGTFFSGPSYAYKYAQPLNIGLIYRLVIKNLRTGNVDSAETNIINTDPNFASPGNFYVPFFVGTSSILSLPIKNLGPNTFSLTSSIPTNAVYLEGYMRIKYTTSVNGGPQIDSSFVWKFAAAEPRISTDRSLNLIFDRPDFYSILRDNISPAPANVTRYLDSADVFIWAANQTFRTYLQITNAQGGITADQIKPNYTNIVGKDAIGIFANRARRIRYNVPFDQITLDSIRRNDQTKTLGFAGFADH